MRSNLLIFAALALLASACDPRAADLTCDSKASVTLADKAQPEVFDAVCKACHNALDTNLPDYSTIEATTAVVGKVSRYADAKKTLKIVDPGNLHNSSMWLKLMGAEATGFTGPNGEHVGGKMPAAGEVTAAQLATIKQWICSGAK